MASDNFVDNRLLCGVTHDLAEELFHFANHKPWQSGLYSKLLVKADDLRVVLIAIHAGAKIKEHHTDGTKPPSMFCEVRSAYKVQEKSQDFTRGTGSYARPSGQTRREGQ